MIIAYSFCLVLIQFDQLYIYLLHLLLFNIFLFFTLFNLFLIIGQVLRSNPKMQDADKYAINMLQLTNQARGVVRDLDPKNELRYLRVRTKEIEYMVAFGKIIFFFLLYSFVKFI